MNHKKKSFISYDLFLFLLLTSFIVTIGLINPAFFSLPTLFDLIRNQTVYILLAFALLPVVILGGLDISFVAVASLATFLARLAMTNLGIGDSLGVFYVISILFGVGVGLIIGSLISSFKLGIFELSLGTTPLIFGFITIFSSFINIPSHGPIRDLKGWNMKWLFTVQSAAGRSGLHVSVLIVILAFIGMVVFLRYTTPGRAIYAMGSDKSVATRTGINIKNIYLTVFSIMGAIAAIANVTSTGMGLGSGSMGGNYLRVYATVIIGGASIHGGKGSVLGTLLGVLLGGID